jgi:hypothetical protein
MSTNKVKPKIKGINFSAMCYHHFEYSVSEFGMFDDADDGTPVVIGSRNLVDAVIRKLPKNITIFYYKKSAMGYWEKKAIYDGNKRHDGSQ